MGSMNSPNSWAPYYTYRDCSQGICSIYCPQWCYIVYPPPPPFSPTYDDDYPFNFSPLVIAVIGILSSAILLIAYYTILSKYCRRRRMAGRENQVLDFESNHVVHHDHYQGGGGLVGLDESTIKSIEIRKYKRGEGSVDGTECSVCLSEFEENEELRWLPKCNHSFHIACIDTWLKSHSNCPLCRANVVLVNTQDSLSVNVSSVQVHHDNDLIEENGLQRENMGVRDENQEERSNSLSVADILRIRDDDDDDIEMGNRRFCSGVGSSQGENLMKNG